MSTYISFVVQACVNWESICGGVSFIRKFQATSTGFSQKQNVPIKLSENENF